MATEMKIQIIESQTVKPSSPTPDNCRSYKLSFLDQLCPRDSIPLLLFYPQRSQLVTSISERSQLLIKSLSQTLTSFSHFAGRFRDNISIECNDDGAEFEATRVNCPLSKILSNPDFGTLTKFVPRQVFPEEERFRSPLLLVKANFFDCGGLAIGVCLSHKAGDVSTLSTFINCWAAATSKSEVEPALTPQFVSPESIFPTLESLASYVGACEGLDAAEEKEVKRLVFDRPRIEALRSKAAINSTVPIPTRVEVVSALIWKCMIEALSEKDEPLRHSTFFQTVNIRKRMNPCLPETSVGNFVCCFKEKISSSAGVCKVDLKDLVVLLREGIIKFKAIWDTGSPSEALSSLMDMLSVQKNDDGIHQFLASSWCRFPLYGADFGWGKPVWVCPAYVPRGENVCWMIDTRDGEGIEVTLLLGEEDMKRFETNPELLAFASLDPPVIV